MGPNTAHVAHELFVLLRLPGVNHVPRVWGNRPMCLLPIVSHETARQGPALALPRDRQARPGASARGRMGFRICQEPGGGKAPSGHGAGPASSPFPSLVLWLLEPNDVPLSLVTASGQGDCPGAAQSPGPCAGPECLGPWLPGRRR